MKPIFTFILSFILFANLYANDYSQQIPPPVAQFNASAYSGCAPLTVTFYNSSEGNGTYSWNFGDPSSPNNTSVACSPTHTFVNAGSYLVTLTYLYNSITYTDTATIRVWPLPNPVIAGADTTCAKSTRNYSATGFTGSSYYWTVTGGAIVGPANTANVTVNWTTPGVGMLTVVETSIYGCSNSKTFKVLVAPQPELGNICENRKERNGTSNGKPTQLPCKCENSIATFQALGLDNFTLLENDLYTFQWTVTGGSITSGAGTNSIQVLVGAGPTMTVSLIVFNQFGCIDSSKCVFDVCKAPIASFTADTACFKGQTNFNGSASSVQSQIVGYSWDFGDNTSTSTLTAYTNYIYGAPGIYYATLTVKNLEGCFDDTIVPVLVQPGEAPPITCVGTVCHGTKKCYNTPYFPGATYTWTVTGNAAPVTYQGDTVVCVTWGNGPMGTITLEVVGGPYLCGKNTVNVPIFPSSIAIYGPDTICTGSPFSFSTDIIPGSCYSWSIKNPANVTVSINPSNNPGNQISGTAPNTPGTYEITLNMNNDLVCCHGTITRKIEVQAPIQLFGVFSLCEYDSSNYFSSVPVTWSVTNGVISNSTSTTCTIHWGAANYGTITATALFPATVCDNYATYSVTLFPKPDASPIYGNTLVCKGGTETYTHDPLASGVTSVFAINPGTGITVLNTSPLQVKFNTVGSYTVSVVYTNLNGCTDTSYLNITVLDTLKPSIIGPVQVCKGSTYVYTMSSNPGNAWQWNAIGGQILYQSPDSLIINWGNINQGQVTIQNTLCGGFNTITVNVNAIPTGLITVGSGSCKGDTVRLSGPPGYSYLWNNSSTSQSIIATNPSSSFWVILGKNGCFDTLYKTFSPFPKLPKPNVNITVNCMLAPSTPVPYQMTATFNANWHYSWTPVTAIPSNSDTTDTHFDTVFNSIHTVIVTNEYGCKDTASVQLNTNCVDTCVGPNCGGGGGTPCTATFSVQYNPCSGIFSFTQLSGNTILAVLWDFGDGDFSNNFSPLHYFATTGTHSVTLSVFCGTHWITQTFNINVPYILLPKIKHSFPNWCDYNTISLSHATGSVVLGATTESVDWGVGPLTYGSLPQTHTYATAGTYFITYTVSAPGCTRIVYDTAVILPFNAAFGFCDSGCVGQAVQFVDHSTTAAQYPIVNWNWTFGDLTGSNLQSPFHIYNSTGTYTPQLVIQNQQGCKDSVTLNIVITTFNAGALTFKKNGVSITLPGNSTFDICEGDYIEAIAPTASLYTYAWNNGVSTTIDTITKSGKYWVVIANGRGCTDTLGPFYVIVNPVPFASIIASDTFCLFSNAKLSALTGPGYTYAWTSNPPNTIAATNPTFFPIIGTGDYMITLQVTNLFGCTAVDSQIINITPAPIVNITANTTAQLCEGDSIKLTANITGSYTSGIWSTGETTLSIWVRSNDNYSFTVQNAFGCTWTAQYPVTNIAKRPDLSNVPKGCYKLCCKPGWNAVVCGPYPKPGQALLYKWFKNNVFVTNTQNININSTGNYHVHVVDSASGCGSISAPFSVDCTGAPVANILSSSPNPTLCKGVAADIDLEADSVMEEVIYTWLLNGEEVATGPVYAASAPGTYTLIAYFSECCSDTDHVVISEGDCCFPPNTNFTLIQDSTVINSDAVWDGKYYVAGRVFVKGSAILDMTEIDVVFDRDGEIIFEDTSVIRATNSVFRPCDMYEAWQGFSFYDMSHGFVQANNFKSADSAILVKTYGRECVKLNDNFFSNCHVGITIDRQQAMPYNQAITNNSFVVDNYNFNTPALYNSSEFWGIRILSTQMQELVSQNQFRSSDFSSQGNMFYGILGMRSSAVMSENKFTNMYRGIDWTANIASTFIENNEFEQTYKVKFPSDYQIRLSDCTQPLLVFANEFRNSDNYNQSNTAIYADHVSNMNIRDNNIKGFQHGIYTLNLNSCVINENDVDNSGRLGIYNADSRKVDINCNVIRMKDFKAIIGGGGFNNIGISMQNGDASNRIFTNCIFDCRYSILVSSTLVNAIPLIHNNYMYNYIVSGIRTVNHTGTIGTLASPGKNTFVSNNRAGGAVDIFGSGGAVVENCNFGILSIAGTASTGGACPANLMYSSTASCGHQIVNTKFYKTDQWDICDIFNDNLEIIVGLGIPGQVKDSIKYQDNGNLVSKDRSKEELLSLSRVFIGLKDRSKFDNWMTEMKNKNALNSFYLGLLNAEWSKLNVNQKAGLQLLNSLATQFHEETELKTILSIAWEMELGIVPTSAQISELKAIDSDRGRYAAMARDLVHLLQGEHDYIFDTYKVTEDAELLEIQKRKNSYVSVIPNPATEKVTVKFKLDNDGDNEVVLTDISGRIIAIEVVTIEEGQCEMNISALSPGMYFVVVKDAVGKKSYTAKLIKE